MGGWNAANLANILSNDGYKVKMLITLDPVGEGTFIKFADIYMNQLYKVKAETWINIYADSDDSNFSDWIAMLGGQWKPNNIIGTRFLPTHHISTNLHHENVNLMLDTKVVGNKTVLDLLIQSIIKSVS